MSSPSTGMIYTLSSFACYSNPNPDVQIPTRVLLHTQIQTHLPNLDSLSMDPYSPVLNTGARGGSRCARCLLSGSYLWIPYSRPPSKCWRSTSLLAMNRFSVVRGACTIHYGFCLSTWLYDNDGRIFVMVSSSSAPRNFLYGSFRMKVVSLTAFLHCIVFLTCDDPR
jgi:hypothetical protein